MFKLSDIRSFLLGASIGISSVEVQSFHEAYLLHKANLAISHCLSFLDKFEFEHSSNSSSVPHNG